MNGARRDADRVLLDPARDLYGGLLFQRGRFRRLRYPISVLRATECIAEAVRCSLRAMVQPLSAADAGSRRPGVRDAATSAIQACIPHARVLPGGAASIVLGAHPLRLATAHPRARALRDGD